MGQKAASIVIDELMKNSQLLVCAATGNSPLSLYQQLGKEAKKETKLFDQIRVLPLDEWVGLPSTVGTCDAYLRKHFLEPLSISEERYFAFNPLANNLNEECLRIQTTLKKQGPIDICIVGLGKNGHLGFNEPSNELQAHCHIANLTPQSQQHTMISNSNKTPTKGITLGMQDILTSKRILLIVSGNGKKEAKEQLFSGVISSQWPASLLWKHNNVDCLVVY